MFLSILVIKQGTLANALIQDVLCDKHALLRFLPVEGYHLQGVEGHPGIPIGKQGDLLQKCSVDMHILLPQSLG